MKRSWSGVRKQMLSDDGGEKQTMKELMSKYMDNTAAHGIPNVWRSKNVFRKVWWLVFTLWALGMLGYQMYVLITKYYSYPVGVNVKMNYDDRAPFPAVTVCNMNPVKMSKLLKLDTKFRKAFQRNETAERIELMNSLNLTLTNETDIDAFWEEIENSDAYFSREDTEYSARQALVQMLDTVNTTTRRDLGYRINDMLLSCTWQGLYCGRRNFTYTLSKTYGTCLTFNSLLIDEEKPQKNVKTRSDLLFSNRAGAYFGLQLDLLIKDYEYVPELAPAAGVRVVIHDRDIMPFPESQGLSVSPGTAAEIAIRRTDIKRKPLPYEGTDCVDPGKLSRETLNKANLFSELYGVSYSVEGCFRTCYQLSTIQSCQCADPYIPYQNRNGGPLLAFSHLRVAKKNLKVCNSSNTKHASCLQRNVNNRFSGALRCNCRERCDDTIYYKTVTSAKWPTKASEGLLMSRLEGWGHTEKLTDGFNNGNISLIDNVLRFNIFYEDLTFVSIVEEVSYEVSSILSDIGGQLGLWMGLSIVALAEVFEFLADILCHCCRRKKRERQVVDLKNMQAISGRGNS